MRALRVTGAVIATVAATFAFATPASATPYSITNSIGDQARWNPDTNVLTACDNAAGNGTAKAKLVVSGGNIHQVFDGNGAVSGCDSVTLNVNESSYGYLYVCTSDSGSCLYYGHPVDL